MSIPYRVAVFPFLLVLLFFYIYAIEFSFIDFNSRRLVFLGLLFALPLVYQQALCVLRAKVFIVFLVLCSLYIFYLLLLHALRGDFDTSLVRAMFGFLAFSCGGALLIASILLKLGVSRYGFLTLLQAVFLLQTFFIILSFVSPTFKSLVIEYLPYSASSNLNDESFRARGFTNSSGATLSLLQSIGLFITAYLYRTTNSSSYRVFLLLSFGVGVIALLPVGRTGLMSLLFIPLMFDIASKKALRFLFLSPLFLVISFYVFKVGYQFISGGVTNEYGVDVFEYMVDWVVTEFSFQGGGIQSATVNALLEEHLVFSEGLLNLAIGDPNLWSGQYRLKGDVGYIRILNSSGFIGFTIFYGMFVYLFFRMWKLANSEKRLVLLLGLFLFFAEIKEPFFYKQEINSVLLIVYIYFISTRREVVINAFR